MSGLGDLECGESLLGDGEGGTTLRNLGFEDGAFGFASSWESGSETQRGALAEFGLETAESFEYGWSNRPYAFELAVVVAAQFSSTIYASPPTHEDFERGWSNFPFFRTTFTGITCVFTGPHNADGFEDGWANGSYLYAFAGGLTAAVFNAEAFEDFESGWGNGSYAFTWPGGTAVTLSGVRAKSVEDFEDVILPQLYTASDGTDLIETVGHGLSANYRVVFDTPVAGAMPSPIAPTVPYYLQAVPDADHFAVALLPSAGSPVDITTTGSGLLRWSAPYENWTTHMATL